MRSSGCASSGRQMLERQEAGATERSVYQRAPSQLTVRAAEDVEGAACQARRVGHIVGATTMCHGPSSGCAVPRYWADGWGMEW